MYEDANSEEYELTLEEIREMMELSQEEEIDLDDLSAYFENVDREKTEIEEYEKTRNEKFISMLQTFKKGKYQEAYHKLKDFSYRYHGFNKSVIDKCYRICADNDVVEAMIYQVEISLNGSNGIVTPNLFPYLQKLSDYGYIKSFRWLGDCYYRGIGCEKDLKMAQKSYFESMLFAENMYSAKMFAFLNPELRDYSGDNLYKTLIKRLTFPGDSCSCYARTKIADLIMNGSIKDYMSESAYPLLKLSYEKADGIASYYLGDWVFRGIGTKADPGAASWVIDDAILYLESALEDPTGEDISQSFYEEKDYKVALEKANILMGKIDEECKKIDDDEKFSLNEDEMEEYERFSFYKEPLFIKRAFSN